MGNLKSKYVEGKRKLKTSGCGSRKPKFYNDLDDLLGNRPVYNLHNQGIESQTIIVEQGSFFIMNLAVMMLFIMNLSSNTKFSGSVACR